MSQRPATSSGRKTADAAIIARPCLFKGLILEGDGTNACNVILYDNASAASGTVIAKLLLSASTTAIDSVPKTSSFVLADGIECNNGIFADVTGTGAAYIVHYSSQ